MSTRTLGTPTRIRALAAFAALLTVGLIALLLLETGGERDGLHTIGVQAGPEVITTGDLYFALNDMDAQLANVLLVGRATDLGLTRTDAVPIYEQRRQQADADVRQAIAGATDPRSARTTTTILDQLGRYEALAAQTILLDDEHPHPPGQPDPVTLDRYRQATDLLTSQLLPAAQALTDREAGALEATYRYLVDPDRAARYRQAFLDKSQQLLGLPDATLDSYDAALAGAVDRYRADHTDVGWTGFYGTEFRNITFPGEREAAEETLLRYQIYQRDDRQIRALVAAGRRGDAVAFCTSYAPGRSNDAFDRYDKALASLIAINTNAFGRAIGDGTGELDGWTPGLLVTGALLPGLILAGIWPRLAEYR